MRKTPVVALVGRPNVGKSTLFNRLIGKRQAVVADIAGTTRDRLERPVTWNDRTFLLVDMAGLEPALKEKNEIRQGMQEQVEKALDKADLIIWVTDGREGATASDALVAELLRRLHKPVVVAANKCDAAQHDAAQFEFSRFGFKEVVPLSALHGRGVADLLEALTVFLPVLPDATEEQDRELRLAIVGRPNVGKSTLLNSLAGDTRSVVSAEAGTTRDSVDTRISAAEFFPNIYTRWKEVRIVDTAGIRRAGKIDRSIEGWSVVRSYDAIDEAEVVLLLTDATEQLVHQDLQVSERVVNSGRPLILLLNKWDLVLEKKGIIAGTEEDEAEQETVLDGLRAKAPFLHWVPVLFLSAKKHINTDVIGKLVLNSYIAWSKKIEQEDLDALTEQLRTQPRLTSLKKITYEHNRPPVFHLHVKGSEIPHFSTRRYVENAIRDFFSIGPTPIKIWVSRG